MNNPMPNYTLINIINIAFQIYTYLIIARVILSWVQHNPYNQYIQLLYKVTEPVLEPFRKLFSSFNIGVDFSPILAIFALNFVKNIIFKMLL